jgi:hypothetical protein
MNTVTRSGARNLGPWDWIIPSHSFAKASIVRSHFVQDDKAFGGGMYDTVVK